MTSFQKILAAPACAIALAGCGLTDPTGLISAPTPKTPPLSCVVADVSGSTARVRSSYISKFQVLATQISQHDGQICLMLAGGDPTETTPMFASLAAQTPDQSLYAPGQRQHQVEIATQQFAQLIKHPPITNPYTALLEAIDVVANDLHSGSTCMVLSDAIQSSPVATFYTADLSPTGIHRLLEALAAKRLLPRLSDVIVSFPLPLYDGPGGAHLSADRQTEIQAFWQAWAAATGAHLIWGATSS